MATFTDQLQRTVNLPALPGRIISLVPSQTELLYDLGLEKEVVGITKFCVHPEKWFREKTRVGGTRKLHPDRIRDLQPDLIIGNKEENDREQLEALMEEFPVWVSDITTLQDALDMIASLGEITGKQERALEISAQIRAGFSRLQAYHTGSQDRASKTRAAYFIWRDPWMVAGGNTFINEMMRYCGLENCFAELPRYPEIALSQLQTAGCRLVLLSSEPFPFKEKHAAEIRRVVPDSKILLVDGEMFSWYGSRLLKASEYFRNLVIQ